MALKRRVFKKETGSSIKRAEENLTVLQCSSCPNTVENVSSDAKSVICAYCTQKLVAPPDVRPKKLITDEVHPRGWHLKKLYISPLGRRYEFGREIVDDNKSVQEIE